MVRFGLAMGCVLTLAGCGGGLGSSSFNPFNWFRAEEPAEAIVPVAAARDTRPLASRITDIAVDPVPGGVILRARAVAGRGWYGADLVLDPARSLGGTLAYTFRATAPEGPGASSGALLAGIFISDADLLGISSLAVIGRENGLTARP